MSKHNPKNVTNLSVSRASFGLQAHCYNTWSATVPGDLTKEHLEDPQFWALVSRDLRVDDEIRIVADDYSFIARGIVVHREGSFIKLHIFQMNRLQAVMNDVDFGIPKGWSVKMRGPKKWCVGRELPDNGGIEWLKEMIPDQATALRELQELLRALGS